MQGIKELAANVDTPLSLAGLTLAIVFYILKEIINRNIFPSLSRSFSKEVLVLIINRLFVLALIAMCLGFVAFIIPPPDPVLPEKRLIGTVFIEGGTPSMHGFTGSKAIRVEVPELDKNAVVGLQGRFTIDYFTKNEPNQYSFSFAGDGLRDTVITVNREDYTDYLQFHLKKRLSLVNNNSVPERIPTGFNHATYRKPVKVIVDKFLIFDVDDDDEDMDFGYEIQFIDTAGKIVDKLYNSAHNVYVEEPEKIGGEKENKNVFFKGQTKIVDAPIAKIKCIVWARSLDGGSSRPWKKHASQERTYELIEFDDPSPFMPWNSMKLFFRVL